MNLFTGLCEFKMGNAKGSSSSAFLIIGTGTGGCLCDEKGVIYGKDGYAGEFHNLSFMNFKTGKIDQQGNYSSMTALIEIYNNKITSEDKAIYGNEVCDKYLKGDKTAKEAMEEYQKKPGLSKLSKKSLKAYAKAIWATKDL
ncbi:MAG: ROK family protein [Hungatella sp.]|jgi:predicted NBD/HSP70 family sugar kinase|nr:ROK family protein [Hungatella sp.]